MKGAFTCPHCMTQNACDCESCKQFIKEGEPVNKWDETGEFHICGKCGLSYSPDQSLDAEFKLMNMKNKPFIVANVREILDMYDKEEISFSRMVEMLNEKAAEFYEKSIVKNCETCKHALKDLDNEPCTSCEWYDFNFSKWEPK